MFDENLEKDPYLKGMTYELFMLLLSLLSILNLILELLLPKGSEAYKITLIMQSFTSIFFIYDFLLRFITAPSKKVYILNKFGWADFLAAIPFSQFRIFRILRVLKVSRAIGTLGIKKTLKLLETQVANAALYSVFFVMILVVEFGAIGVLYAESGAPNANIINASDALWWAFISITTVGYGDTYPVTNTGRLVGVLTVTVGVGLFGTISGFLANKFLKSK